MQNFEQSAIYSIFIYSSSWEDLHFKQRLDIIVILYNDNSNTICKGV